MLATGCVLVRITIGTANKIDEISFRGRGAWGVGRGGAELGALYELESSGLIKY